jgi:hypothetical protein
MREATIFMAALDKPAGAQRAAFLEDACGGDERLRRRVEALLRAHAEPDEILDRPAEPPDGPAASGSVPRDRKATGVSESGED